ncbi:MAG: glucan endo-1,6-beta-glucosidase, partial [Leadbetterella sp.]|nr:glucan endo-1,6-beta-glucosidase [Leadbetterella sp.]
ITISEGGFIHRNVEYYAIAHLSKFVEDGAKRIKTNPVTAVEQVAFKNPDGTVAVVILNDANNFQKVNIVRGNAQVTFNQEPRSVITYVLE